MIHSIQSAIGLMLLTGVMCLAMGCGSPVEVRTYEIKNQATSIEQAIELLSAYAKGTKPGSEVTSLQKFISEMRESSPDKADIVAAAFENLMDKSSNSKEVANEAIRKLKALDYLDK